MPQGVCEQYVGDLLPLACVFMPSFCSNITQDEVEMKTTGPC